MGINSFMDRITAFMEKNFVPIASKIGQQRHLSAVRDGMSVLIPVTIIGGLFILLAQPPVNLETMQATNIINKFLIAWKTWADANMGVLLIPYNLTINAISIYAVVGITYQLSGYYKQNKLVSVVSSLVVFFISCGQPVAVEGANYIPLGGLGATSLFTGIFIAIAVVEIENFFINKNITIRIPASVPANISAPFQSLISILFTVTIFLIANIISLNMMGSSLGGLVSAVITPLISASGSLPSILFLTTLSGFFWFFGIHGDNIVSPIITPIMTFNLAANLEAYTNGTELPYVFAGQLNAVFSGWLGAYATVTCMLLFCKSSQLKTLGRIAIPSTMFNINEPLVFGIPQVLNPYTYIPGLIMGIFNICVVYFLMDANIIGKVYLTLPWTTPPFLNALLSTMDWKVLVVWIVLFIINVIVRIPFMKAYDKQLLQQELENNN